MADNTSLIQQHEQYLRELEALTNQVNAVQPSGYYSFGRGQQQFNRDRAVKLKEIRDAAQRSERDLLQLRQQAAKPAPGQKPALTADQQLKAQEREDKRNEAIETEKPQAELAKNRLEQQKAADAATAAALGATVQTAKGAVPQSLNDLLTKFTVKRDPETGSYAFSQPNTEGTLSPLQKRNETALAARLKTAAIPESPDELFGPGVAAPIFDAKTRKAEGGAGKNPFIGDQDTYLALKSLYDQSRPKEATELVVPASALDKAYKIAAPAYGGALPGNPVDQDAAVAAADTFLHSPDRLNFERKAAVGPLGVTPAPVFGPQPATPEDAAQLGARAVVAKAASFGLPPDKVAEVRTRRLQTGASPEEEQIALQQIAADQTASRVLPALGGAVTTVLGASPRAVDAITQSVGGGADALSAALIKRREQNRAAAILQGANPATYDDSALDAPIIPDF